jgi:hypothetical protein
VLVFDPGFIKLLFEIFIKNLLEQVLETPVIGFQDRVLGGQVDRPAKVQAVVQ